MTDEMIDPETEESTYQGLSKALSKTLAKHGVVLIPVILLAAIVFFSDNIGSNLNSLLVFTLGLTAMLIFYATKKDGFGSYNTATLIIVLVITMSGLLYFSDKLEQVSMTHILFAIIGFAGGLFANKEK